MKKTLLIHPALSEVIASLGHMDRLVIADAGLPIPPETRRIDLALTKGIPTFADTLRVVLSEMHVERAMIGEEMLTASPHVYETLRTALRDIPIEAMPHTDAWLNPEVESALRSDLRMELEKDLLAVATADIL
jgi:D-ribose pyranase